MKSEFFKSMFRTLGRIFAYVLISILAVFIFGKLNVKALEFYTDLDNSRMNVNSSIITYREGTVKDYISGLEVYFFPRIVFDTTDDDMKYEYDALLGDTIELGIQVCAPVAPTLQTLGGILRVDYMQVGRECVVHTGSSGDKVGHLYTFYIVANNITGISYNPALYPNNKPDSFYIDLSFRCQFGFYNYSSKQWIGLVADDSRHVDEWYPTYYIPSYIYYDKVNRLREQDNLEPVDDSGKQSYQDILDDSANNRTWFEKISVAIADTFSGVKGAIVNLGNSIGSWFSNLWNNISNGLSNLGSNIINGIRDLFIPNDNQIGDVLNQGSNLSDNFGFIGQSFNFIINLFSNISGYNGRMPFDNYNVCENGSCLSGGSSASGSSGGGFRATKSNDYDSPNADELISPKRAVFNGCIDLPKFEIGGNSLFDKVTFWEAQNVCVSDNPVIDNNIGTIRFITSVAIISLFISWSANNVLKVLSKSSFDEKEGSN